MQSATPCGQKFTEEIVLIMEIHFNKPGMEVTLLPVGHIPLGPVIIQIYG